MARFTIDSEATSVFIEARSSLHPIHSATKGLHGYFEGELGADGLLDLRSAPQATVELPIDLLSSGNPLYDREMKRRVDARRHPEITAILRKMTPASSSGNYVAEGDVTFKGVTQTVSDELALTSPEPGVLVFEGQHVFNVRDFGMEPPKIMMLRVYPEVTVKARIVARADGS